MTKILFDSLRLHRAILELRHPNAYLYWDRAGKCLSTIEESLHGKLVFKKLDRNECILQASELPYVQASFGIRHVTLSGNSLKNGRVISDVAPAIFDIVRNELEIKQIDRFGFRLIYVLQKETEQEAEDFVTDLDLVEIRASRFKEFGSEAILLQPAIRVRDGDTHTRIFLSAGRREDADHPDTEFTESNPEYAVVIDLDFYKENVSAQDINISDFVHKCEKKVKDHISSIINK